MNEKFFTIIFLLIWLSIYLVSLNFIQFNYFEVKHIWIEELNNNNRQGLMTNYTNNLIEINKEINKKGYFLTNLFVAELENNYICQIDVLNIRMIKKIINKIKNTNTKFYAYIISNGLCSKPETFLAIIIEKISIQFSMILLSFLLTIIFVGVYIEINEVKKNDDHDINSSFNSKKTELEKDINWLEYV